MFEVKGISFDDLTKDEKVGISNNGVGKEYASYIKVIHNDKVILLESDAMEPEDATFCRDLSWVSSMLEKCYELGRIDHDKKNKKG